MIALVGLSPVSRGAILERLKNGENLTNAEGAKGIIVPSVQQALQDQLTKTGVVDVPLFKANTRVLFQGDSITDGERNRNDCPHLLLGQGYQFIIAARFSALYPEKRVTFINRAVSGNNVNMMAARWQTDTLNLKPDLLSILIGINDSGIGGGDERKVPLEQYEQVYDKLLADARAANPNIRLVLGEPFYLPKEGRKEGDARDQDIRQRQAIIAKLATKYQAALVKYQKVFDDACKRAPAPFWAADGVHPTYSGHQLMADEWVRTVTQFFKCLPENGRADRPWSAVAADQRGEVGPAAVGSRSALPFP